MLLARYDLRDDVVAAIDVSPRQSNYAFRFGDDAAQVHMDILQSAGLSAHAGARMLATPMFTNGIFIATEQSYDPGSDFDGFISPLRQTPFMITYGDCPQLMVVGEDTLGVVHATRETIGEYVMQRFFSKFAEYEDLKSVQVAFSPYIPTEEFDHNYLGFKRVPDWYHAEAIVEREGAYYLDLERMIRQELERLGIGGENIQNKHLSTTELSRISVANGGPAISHRHALQTRTREVRGGMVLMRR